MIRKVFHDIARRHESGLEAYHEFLVEGPGIDAAASRVRRFLQEYQLVRYGSVEIRPEDSLEGADPSFAGRLGHGVEENRRRVRGFIEELRSEGVVGVEELADMGQGHLSKTVHTISHLLDGFFGIDSFFYNLVEDSHWVSDQTRSKIAGSPDRYMIVAVRATV